MKNFICRSLILMVVAFTATASGHFTAKGHVHTISETQQVFLNPDCRATASCDLKRFTLTTQANEIWFSDDPNHPTYGNGVIMEYETESVAALEKYVIVQFMKGCVFHSKKTATGRIIRNVSNTITSFGEDIPYCFPQWVIDSQDSDPAYNSDPEYGRIYLARWNEPGSYDRRTQRYYGAEKPKIPVVYMTDYPSGAFVSPSGVKNTALQFNTCIYKASDVPAETRRGDINFAKPLSCLQWQNVYIYDFATAKFRTDLAAPPWWEEPAERVNLYRRPLFIIILIALMVLAVAVWRKYRRSKFLR